MHLTLAQPFQYLTADIRFSLATFASCRLPPPSSTQSPVERLTNAYAPNYKPPPQHLTVYSMYCPGRSTSACRRT
jgi:hypothetical protein